MTDIALLRQDEPAFLRPRHGGQALLVVIAAFIVAALAWAWLSKVDTLTRGQGRVIPSKELQRVAHLEGGIVKEILARNGEHVRKGQLLIRLDPTASTSERDRGALGEAALQARLARLKAEVTGKAPRFDPQILVNAPELVAAERSLFSAREIQLRVELNTARARVDQAERASAESRASLAARQESLDYAEREVAMIRPMVQKGIEPQAALLRAEADNARAAGEVQVAKQAVRRASAGVSEARSTLRSVNERYKTDSADALATTRAEVGGAGAAMPALADRVARTEVRAPVAGTINRILVNTIGGVAKPGEPLVEIVPQDDTLVVEARISPGDIGFVHPSQPAVVKLTAYDYAIYGSLNGRVERISADSIAEERTGEPFYLVRVRTDGLLRDGRGNSLPIVPGMIAEVDILGQKRRVIDYVLVPVERLKQTAFRER